MTKIRLWDFDGVLFKNSSDDYTDKYLHSRRIVSMKELRSYKISFSKKQKNILFTGRGLFQQKLIFDLLTQKGYKFSGNLVLIGNIQKSIKNNNAKLDQIKGIFWMRNRKQYPIYNPQINEKQYFKKYYKWKRSVIRYFVKTHGRDNVEVIDDSRTIIKIAKKEKAIPRYIDTINLLYE